MLDPRFVFLAAVIDFAGVSVYAFDTLRGHTKPNRVTWFLWALVPLITFFAQLSEGVGLSAVLTFTVALGPLLILLASFLNKQSYWKVTKFDLACGAISVLALTLWAITKDGLAGIILSLVADFMAGLPTIIKAFRYPETEYANAYLAGIFSSGLTILTIHFWNLSTVAFPAYLLVMCVMFFTLIKFPKFRPARSSLASRP